MVLFFEDASTLGLWVLISQIGIWLGALDLGLSSSSIRFFVDPVSRRDVAGLRGRFHATLRLTTAQGAGIALFGLGGPFLGMVFSIPAQQQALFNQLLFTQCVVSGVSFLSRPFASILLAAQRFELNYLGNAASFFLSLGLAWIGLSRGWGLWSLMVGSVVQYALTTVLSVYGVYRLGFFPGLFQKWLPAKGLMARIVSESLSFAIGPLGGMATGIVQSAFLSRFFGLEIVAAWNVGTKAATVLGQILSKFFESSFSGLSELEEAGRRDRMFVRFGQVWGWSMVSCAACLLILFFLNGPFVEIWAGKKVTWPAWGTWAACLMLLCATLHRAFSEAAKILLLWNPIRYGPLLDFGVLVISLFLAWRVGGLGAFAVAVAVGPFLAGIIMNGRALHAVWGRPVWQFVPSPALFYFLLLLLVFLGALGGSILFR